ncbi:MAG: DUF192 domain-containing protein [Patescibacteria group bacterium]|nr:DUF192 domain-containing protein [Patescibacteria group bacterium]
MKKKNIKFKFINNVDIKQLMLIFVSIFFLLAVFLFCFFKISNSASSRSLSSKKLLRLDDGEKIRISLNEREFEVEVVNTQLSRNQGLGGRSEIGSDGMLFVFFEKQVPIFWMKDVRFDLDFIWLNEGKIVDLENNVTQHNKGLAEEDLPLLLPNQKVNMVLEVDSGFIERNGVKIGQKITVPRDD